MTSSTSARATRHRLTKWLVRSVAALAAAYLLFGGVVAAAMLQGPETFGKFMTRVPGVLVWGLLPAPRMWMWARGGTLKTGDEAPDFTLSTVDHSKRVTLSSHRGDRPVVLVFGSYT
jgi:hypothetical protein